MIFVETNIANTTVNCIAYSMIKLTKSLDKLGMVSQFILQEVFVAGHKKFVQSLKNTNL